MPLLLLLFVVNKTLRNSPSTLKNIGLNWVGHPLEHPKPISNRTQGSLCFTMDVKCRQHKDTADGA